MKPLERRSRACFVYLLIFAGFILAGCTVGPNFQRPTPSVPAQWSELPQSGVTTEQRDLSSWWRLFQDEKLNSLIEEAVRSNLDLKIAEARVREARALRGVVAADAFPVVEVSGSYSRSRASENAFVRESGSDGNGGNRVSAQNLFQVGFDANWEIDLFGRTRRAAEAANADIAASIQNHGDVLVTLLGEVARNYIEVRGTQRRIAIAFENIKVQRKTLEMTRARFQAELGNKLEIAQAEAQLAATEARVPALESAARQGIHLLGVLLGREPEALLPELTQASPIPSGPPEVPFVLPSELLRRRPDVRRAEWEIAAATARIGVATADLFPRFSLTGAVGLQSVDLTNLASMGSRFWSIGPTLLWPVFEGGRIRANIQVQNAREEQALLAYEKTVLMALQDVENALLAYSKEQATRRSLTQAVEASRKAVEIANELYRKGLVSFLNVLQSQGALYQSEDQLVQSDQNISSDLVALFKAMGGGWESDHSEQSAFEKPATNS